MLQFRMNVLDVLGWRSVFVNKSCEKDLKSLRSFWAVSCHISVEYT